MLSMVRQQQQQTTAQHQRSQQSNTAQNARVQPSRVQPQRNAGPVAQQAAPAPTGPSLDNYRDFVEKGHFAKVQAAIGNAVKNDQAASLTPSIEEFKSLDDARERLLAYHTWAYPWTGNEFDEVFLMKTFDLFRLCFRSRRLKLKSRLCIKSMSCILMLKRGLEM
jgi:hypothetical protein